MSDSIHNCAGYNCAGENFEQSCIEALRKNGSRITQPRRLVIKCLGAAKKPLSAREVFETIGDEHGSVDQVSVYRSLETLTELGLLHQVFPSGGYLACFHSNCQTTRHVLIRCSKCEMIRELDVPQDTVAPMLVYLEEQQEFFPDEHVFQMNGLCRSCKK